MPSASGAGLSDLDNRLGGPFIEMVNGGSLPNSVGPGRVSLSRTGLAGRDGFDSAPFPVAGEVVVAVDSGLKFRNVPSSWSSSSSPTLRYWFCDHNKDDLPPVIKLVRPLPIVIPPPFVVPYGCPMLARGEWEPPAELCMIDDPLVLLAFGKEKSGKRVL
jgi:hypothetical protein